MTSKAMWMVRAGEGGLLVDDFRAESIVGIGWVKLGDMTALVTRADFTRAVAQAYAVVVGSEVDTRQAV